MCGGGGIPKFGGGMDMYGSPKGGSGMPANGGNGGGGIRWLKFGGIGGGGTMGGKDKACVDKDMFAEDDDEEEEVDEAVVMEIGCSVGRDDAGRGAAAAAAPFTD